MNILLSRTLKLVTDLYITLYSSRIIFSLNSEWKKCIKLEYPLNPMLTLMDLKVQINDESYNVIFG